LHQPEHVELRRKALHTAGCASRPLFDVCFGAEPIRVTCRMSALRPIVLKKSFWGDERNFLELLIRFERGDVRDHIDSSKIDHGPS
jgi:hypothetical protein